MPVRYSELFNIPHKLFLDKGVYDGCVNLDSKLHIDPSLLKKTKIKEFENAYSKFTDHFQPIFHLTKHVKHRSSIDRCFSQIYNRLIFKEKANSGLGYSVSDTHGNGISGKLSMQLANSAIDIISIGIEDPVIFELLPFIEENIGADRISDMTIAILYGNFLRYTQRICLELSINTVCFNSRNTQEQYNLPCYNNKPIIFIPAELLCDLPSAQDWDDIDRVCTYNRALRGRIAESIGLTWKEAQSMPKSNIKQYLMDNPTIFKEIIDLYKDQANTSYDCIQDRAGIYIGESVKETISREHPLDLSQYKPLTIENVYNISILICQQYKSLIEDNGMYDLLYDNSDKCKNERAPQLLFFCIAESYCKANDIDLNRETNAGVGALDFKLSHGYSAKVNIEIKFSTNDIIKGYEKQLPVYNKAEKAKRSIYLVLRNSPNDQKKIESLLQKEKASLLKNVNSPKVIIVDARIKPSASKR